MKNHMLILNFLGLICASMSSKNSEACFIICACVKGFVFPCSFTCLSIS